MGRQSEKRGGGGGGGGGDEEEEREKGMRGKREEVTVKGQLRQKMDSYM